MNYERILAKKIKFKQKKHNIDSKTLSSYEKEFEARFIYNSVALEGNTLTLEEVKEILEKVDLSKRI